MNKRNIIIVVLILVFAGVGFFIYKRKNKIVSGFKKRTIIVSAWHLVSYYDPLYKKDLQSAIEEVKSLYKESKGQFEYCLTEHVYANGTEYEIYARSLNPVKKHSIFELK